MCTANRCDSKSPSYHIDPYTVRNPGLVALDTGVGVATGIRSQPGTARYSLDVASYIEVMFQRG